MAQPYRWHSLEAQAYYAQEVNISSFDIVQELDVRGQHRARTID